MDILDNSKQHLNCFNIVILPKWELQNRIAGVFPFTPRAERAIRIRSQASHGKQ
jgi:hypothetical protein